MAAWQHDPRRDYLEPALQGRELRGGEYKALPAAERGAGRLVLCSAVLGLELRLEAGEFRFHDAATGTTLGTREELEARLREETAARHREAAARRVAEARVAEFETRLREQRGGPHTITLRRTQAHLADRIAPRSFRQLAHALKRWRRWPVRRGYGQRGLQAPRSPVPSRVQRGNRGDRSAPGIPAGGGQP